MKSVRRREEKAHARTKYCVNQERVTIKNTGVYERGSSPVECRIRNRESPSSNPLCSVSKFGHFRLLQDSPVHSTV